jgi:hypothetical protein
MLLTSLQNRLTNRALPLILMAFGLVESGYGVAAITFTSRVIGIMEGRATPMSAAHGNIPAVATGGTEDTGNRELAVCGKQFAVIKKANCLQETANLFKTAHCKL